MSGAETNGLRPTPGKQMLMAAPTPAKAPPTTGVFYFFNNSKSPQNDPYRLAESSTSTDNPEPLFPPQIISNISTNSKGKHLVLQLY